MSGNRFEKYARKAVLGIEAYTPGPSETTEATMIKLSANENALGTSPRATKAMIAALSGVNRYPDLTCRPIREKLSATTGFPANSFMLGNGLDDVINIMAATFCDEGDEVLVPALTFSVYASAVSVFYARPVSVPMRSDWSIDVQGLAKAANERTKLIFLCNPNNPTGTTASAEEIRTLLEGLQARGLAPLVAIDEAYADFVDERECPGFAASFDLTKEFPNAIVLRTFSKIFGFAGLRLGYALAHPELIAMMNRVRPPYTANAVAQAGALAALGDEEFLRRSKESATTERRRLQKYLASANVPFVPSQANFVFLPTADAQNAAAALREKGVLVRAFREGLRLTAGTEEENERLIAALRETLHI